MTGDSAIEAEGLVKRYGTRNALSGLDLQVTRGTVLGMLGPNGAGKSTAVRILSTLLIPDGGSGRVAGFDVVSQAHDVRRNIGVTGQFSAIDEGMTGTENLVMIGELLGLRPRLARERASELLRWFDLADVADYRAASYSGGTRRRLDLLACLVGRPAVVFLDEPSTGLDPAARDRLWTAIRELAVGGTTVLLTSQYLEEVDALADHIAIIDHGCVIASGSSEALKRRVGGHSLLIRPVDPARIDDVVVLLERHRLSGIARTSQGGVTATVSGDSLVAPIAADLSGAGISLVELSLTLPSLDQVFRGLTEAPADRSEPAA